MLTKNIQLRSWNLSSSEPFWMVKDFFHHFNDTDRMPWEVYGVHDECILTNKMTIRYFLTFFSIFLKRPFSTPVRSFQQSLDWRIAYDYRKIPTFFHHKGPVFYFLPDRIHCDAPVCMPHLYKPVLGHRVWRSILSRFRYAHHNFWIYIFIHFY